MTPELYRKIGEIYHAALELDPGQRLDFLDQACGGDELLRGEVEQLLLSNEQAGTFLAKPAIERVIEKALEPSLSDHREYLIGRELGQYQVLSKIGAGGMGEVFLAEDNRLGRKVALKLLPAEFVADSVRVRRFEREAKAASATAHPNIVSIYDIGRSEDIHYIASEFVEGETLRTRIRRSNLQPVETLDIALQIAYALDSAHGAGFVHRDIKPENIMIRPDGFVKVLDFGLATITKPDTFKSGSQSGEHITTNTDTLPGAIMGTVNYMSPEQIRGQKADARSDLWSLGIVIFEMLAGHLPFRGQSVPDTFVSILDRPPLPLKNAPPELERIIKKLLAKEREDRYQTAQDLASELKALKRRLEFEFDSQGNSYSTSNDEPTSSSEKFVVPPLGGMDVAAETFRLKAGLHAEDAETFRLNTGPHQFRGNYRLAFIGLAVILILALATGGYWLMIGNAPIDSIAIMPLVNQTNDASLEYITDGITETLIHNISQLPKLKVTSRTSVFRYKNQQKDHSIDPAEIGEKFDVRAILTGRVVKLDQILIITLELVSTRDGSRLWAGEFRHQISDLLAAQSVISQQLF